MQVFCLVFTEKALFAHVFSDLTQIFQIFVCFFGDKRIDFGGYYVAGTCLLHLVAY
jgi:hypothetical protein